MYSEEGDIQRTLQVAVRVAAYQYGEYAEMTVSKNLVMRVLGCRVCGLIPVEGEPTLFSVPELVFSACWFQTHAVAYGLELTI